MTMYNRQQTTYNSKHGHAWTCMNRLGPRARPMTSKNANRQSLIGHDSRSRGTPGTHLGPRSGRPCGVVPHDSSRVRPQSTGTVSRMVKVEGALVPRSPRPTRAPARGSERVDLLRCRPRTCSVIPTHLLARGDQSPVSRIRSEHALRLLNVVCSRNSNRERFATDRFARCSQR